jgi:hypothetical protein
VALPAVPEPQAHRPDLDMIENESVEHPPDAISAC